MVRKDQVLKEKTDAVSKPVVTEKVFRWWDYLLYASLTIIILGIIFDALRYWFTLEGWLNYPIIYSIISVLIIITLGNYLGRWMFLAKMRKPVPIPAPKGLRVAIATTFVSHVESLEMLAITLKAMKNVQYPHDTWVLDENDDPQVKSLCEELGVYHFSRKHLPQYQQQQGTYKAKTKWGNYNAWLNEVAYEQYDFISGFDPDHIPDPAFLDRILGYFSDPQIGYVQVAPIYYNQKASVIANGAAQETYAFNSSLQMAAFSMGYPIIIGSHNTHRVSALKAVGGFAAHDADDLLATMIYRSLQWKGVYVPEILVKGLTPVDWQGYLVQQRRWARSVIDLKFFYFNKLSQKYPFRTRLISFLHGFTYLYKTIVIAMGTILYLCLLATGNTVDLFTEETVTRSLFVFGALLLCDFYRQRFYLDQKNEVGLHWQIAMLQLVKWPYFIMALVDVFRNRATQYTLTPKVKISRKLDTSLWPHFVLMILLGFSWIYGYLSGNIQNSWIHLSAIISLLFLTTILLSSFMQFPAPFNPKLIPDHFNPEHQKR